MQAYDLHVHSTFSGGESTLEQLVDAAKALGYKGICFVSYPLEKREVEILKAEIGRVSSEHKFEIYLGFEATNKFQLNELVRKRREFDILLVRGGDLKLERKAVETPEVDILTHPSAINHVVARLAAENNVALEINFREVLLSTGLKRAKTIHNHMEIVRLAKKAEAPIILSAGAVSHWQLKDPKILISYATKIGLELSEAKKAITSLPVEIIARSKARREEVIPGVKVLK